MTFGWASAGRLFVRPHRAGDRAVACAAAMPLVVLALAVAVDYASVSRFRARVQLAADAASLAAAAAIAGQPGCADGSGASDLAGEVATSTFVRHAPRGAAGTPTLAVKSRPAAVTATVEYGGVAPSNFGSALGYDEISVDATATSPARLADSRRAAVR